MASQLGWIDFSSEDRDKVRQVLALAAEKGTLDELGIGQIRDAFADLLFPGISTIQTRAKYFIIVPRLLRDYQNLPTKQKKGLPGFLRDKENSVARILRDNNPDEKGVIGADSVDNGGVKRLPSEIYWNGLRVFALVNTPLSLGEFARHIDNIDDENLLLHEEDGEGYSKQRLCVLPDNTSDWMNEKQLSIHLTSREAQFLKGKMTETRGVEQSILTQLFRTSLEKAALQPNANSELFYFDVLVEQILTDDKVDTTCKENLRLAQAFSQAMEGPHIVLNLLLAEKNGTQEQVDELTGQFEQWYERAKDKVLFSQANVGQWLNVTVDGRIRSVKSHTRKFILTLQQAFSAGDCLQAMRAAVLQQSTDNKGKQSMLHGNHPYQGWVGIKRLDYRWGNARNLIHDIVEGLNHADT